MLQRYWDFSKRDFLDNLLTSTGEITSIHGVSNNAARRKGQHIEWACMNVIK